MGRHGGKPGFPSLVAYLVQGLPKLYPVRSLGLEGLQRRDSIYGKEFRRRVKSCGTHCLITPPRSPKANAICERLNGTLRRDCLDHIIVIDEAHAQRVLKEYVPYYHGRPHHAAATRSALAFSRALCSTQGRRWPDCSG